MVKTEPIHACYALCGTLSHMFSYWRIYILDMVCFYIGTLWREGCRNFYVHILCRNLLLNWLFIKFIKLMWWLETSFHTALKLLSDNLKNVMSIYWKKDFLNEAARWRETKIRVCHQCVKKDSLGSENHWRIIQFLWNSMSELQSIFMLIFFLSQERGFTLICNLCKGNDFSFKLWF